jgi:hypothetical protein
MLVGLLIGLVVGLLIGPVFRSWLMWREYLDASREARLHEETLRRMGVPPPGEDEQAADGPFRPIASQ